MNQRSLETAAKSGNIDLLYELIHEDSYVLDKIDRVPFIDTPLHVAVVAGNTEFGMEVMNLKPSFARKLNADGLSPLHLAIDHSHFWFVLEIIKTDSSLLRLKGRQGMTLLLYAVSRKKIDMVSEFFLVSPESIMDADVNGENAFHIATKNNDQIILKLLIGWILRLCQKDAEWIETRVINQRDKDGNTALHLAAYDNNHQATKLMLKSSNINVNIVNNNGLTVRDIAVLHRPRGIERTIKRHGGKRSVSLSKVKKTSDLLGSALTWKEWRRTMMSQAFSSISEERRNALLVVATLIITATYQTVLQPPGGVSDSGGTTNSTKADSVVMQEGYFIQLWLWNSTGFYLATGWMLCLLSLGRESMFWYYPLLFPLLAAYNVAGDVISPNSRAFAIGEVGSIVVMVGCFLVVWFCEWVQSKRTKAHGLKSGRFHYVGSS